MPLPTFIAAGVQPALSDRQAGMLELQEGWHAASQTRG